MANNLSPQDVLLVRAEILNDPAAVGYAGKPLSEVVALLCQQPAISNPAAQYTRQLLPLWQIKKLGLEQGWWFAVKAASANPAALAFMEYYTDARFESLDWDLPKVQEIAGGLVATGLLTQAQVDAVSALANVAVPGWTETVLGPCRLDVVTEGRNKGALTLADLVEVMQ
jgi:hypothetical protein